MPTVVLIHGAHQSKASFEYLRHSLPLWNYVNLEWKIDGGFHTNLAAMVTATKDIGPVYIVGHSMGGIYAAHLSQYTNCIGGATLSTPWAGSVAADWLRYTSPNYLLYKEVGSRSPVVTQARRFKLPGDWTNYVSTEGNVPGMSTANDCVLTVDSMSARKDIPTKYVKATHYEILMHTPLIHTIGDHMYSAAESIK
jgi:pimeloyl-ACP methyl ester carboxylesterase|tara:strand:- start:266 stop:853 length:588 start_codon:yes stop_codon:yes gene_type:complete